MQIINLLSIGTWQQGTTDTDVVHIFIVELDDDGDEDDDEDDEDDVSIYFFVLLVLCTVHED